MTLLADVLPEPEDGTTVVIVDDDDEWTVLRRDDATAATHVYHDSARWFDLGGYDSEPMSWGSHTKYAVTAYALGEVLATTEVEEESADA